jgi:hypothetical protein
MARINPADRFSIDNQLLACIQDLKGARLAYREACLLLAQQPDSSDCKQAVAELEAEIKGHELTIERLDAAKLAQTAGTVQQAEADRIKAAQDAAKAVAATTPRIKAVLERLVEAFETSVGPALAELETLQRERATQAWAATSGALGRVIAGRSTATLDRFAGDSPARSALLSAIVRAGICRVGPSLAPYITVSTPASGLGTPDQALEGFDIQAQKLDEFLADAIQQATNPQPATTEE